MESLINCPGCIFLYLYMGQIAIRREEGGRREGRKERRQEGRKEGKRGGTEGGKTHNNGEVKVNKYVTVKKLKYNHSQNLLKYHYLVTFHPLAHQSQLCRKTYPFTLSLTYNHTEWLHFPLIKFVSLHIYFYQILHFCQAHKLSLVHHAHDDHSNGRLILPALQITIGSLKPQCINNMGLPSIVILTSVCLCICMCITDTNMAHGNLPQMFSE